MPRQAPTAKGLLSDEGFLAAIAQPGAVGDPARELSDEEFLKEIAGSVPEKPSALGALAGSALEGLAAIPEGLGLALDYMGGARPAQPGGARPLPGYVQGQSYAHGPQLGQQLAAPAAAGLRGAAQEVYPEESRGRGGFLSEDVPAAIGSSLPSMVAGVATGGVGLAVAAGAQMGVPLYYEVLDKTGDKDKAMLGLMVGATLGPLEKMGAGGVALRLAKKLRKIDDATGGGIERGAVRLLLQPAQTTVTETAQEVFEQGVLDKAQEMLTGEDLANLERMHAVVGPSAVVGALFGGLGALASRKSGATVAEPEGVVAPEGPASAPLAQGTDAPPALPQPTPEPIVAPSAAQEPTEPSVAPPVAPVAVSGESRGQEADSPPMHGAPQPALAPSAEAGPTPTYEEAADYLLGAGSFKETTAEPEPANIPEVPEGSLDPEQMAADKAPTSARRLYHGGRASFERFDDAEIASGEARVGPHGSDAGLAVWGHYLASDKDVAQSYADLAKATRGSGHLGEFDIDDSQFVDFERKLAEQEPAMRAALEAVVKKHGLDTSPRYGIPFDVLPKEKQVSVDVGPFDIYEDLARKLGSKKAASQEMLNAGIRGATYASTREGGKVDSPNYIVFSAEDIRPARRKAPTPEPTPPLGVTELFAGPPSPLGKSPSLSVEKAKKAVRRWFVSEGDSPLAARRELEVSKGSLDAEIHEVARNTKALDRAMREIHGRKWRATHAKVVDAAFEGDGKALGSLPVRAGRALVTMRSHLDRLIRLQVKEGGVIDPAKQPDFAKRILESQGSYARRAYRAHIDPAWAEKVDPAVRQRTFDLFRSWAEYASASDEEIHAELDSILQEAKESAENPWAQLAAGKLGRKDLSIYKRRKDVPAELRAFLGEIEDPISNYANSVVKVASVIAKHEAYTNIRESGLGKWLHKKPSGAHTARLTAEGSPGLRPLDGLYTTPEIKRALTEIPPADQSLAMKAMLRANSAIKWGKVLGQPWGIMRNLQGNVTLLLANGHLPSFFRGKEWKLALGKGDLDEQKRLIRLGVLGQGTSTQEWQDLRTSLGKTPDELADPNPGLYAQATGAVERAFEAADNAPKARFFYAEEAALKKAGYSPSEAEALAADRTRDLMPTTARMSAALKAFRRQPFLGSFFAFRAEILRTTGNRLRLIAEELKSANPKVRAMGAKRAAGQLFALTVTPAAAYAINALNGIDADEDKDRREFVPPWDKNSRLLWFGDEAKGTYLDLSDVDPFTMFSDPLSRVLGGGSAEKALEAWAREEGDAFFGFSPSSQLVIDLARGRTEDDKPIDDPIAHLKKAVSPGFVASYERGREKGFGPEAAAAFTGFRRYDFDAEKSFGFDVSRFSWQIRDATEAMKRQTKKDPEEKKRFHALAEEERQTLFEELSEKAKAAIRLGVPVRKVEAMLDERLSQEVTNAILGGRYVPWKEPKEKRR